MTLKQKILKTIFYLTFIPYILLLLLAVYSAIFGIDFFFSTVRGATALIFVGFIALCYSPVLLCCLIYQIVFKIRTKNKPEYALYNTKKFMTITSLITFVLIAGNIAINYVSELYYKYAYDTKYYSSEYVTVIPYDKSYDNCINMSQYMAYDDFISFMIEHMNDMQSYISEFTNYHTGYMVIVSPVINKHIWDKSNPKLQLSDGLQKAKITIEYSTDAYSKPDEKYIMVCVLTAPELMDCDITVNWKEKQ